jgi:hypothetical protein
VAIGVTLLATAAKPDAIACAPVPGKFDAMATVRGKSLLVFVVAPQSILAKADPG